MAGFVLGTAVGTVCFKLWGVAGLRRLPVLCAYAALRAGPLKRGS